MQPLIARRIPGPAKATPPPAPPARRRDPAPSRLAYRIHRLWLTPVFRALMRVGLPAFVVTVAFGVWFSDDGRRLAVAERLSAIRRDVQERPEFMVTMMAIDGAEPEVAAAIRAMLPVNLPISSFDLDLEALRRIVTEVDAVAATKLRVRKGGVLQVTVTERVPVAIWRTDGRLELVDATGHRVATLIDRNTRPDLPLLAGAGADVAVAEARRVLSAAQPIMDRVRGLVRVGERRWDLVLDRDQRVLLPETEPERAIEQVIALHQTDALLDRALSVVDLRNAQRPTIRLAGTGVMETGQNIESETEGAGQ